MLADLSDRAKFRLAGPDRVRYLNGQVTNDVARLRPGESCPALLCNHKGRIEAQIFVHARDGEFWLDGDPSQRDFLAVRLEKYLIADDCEVTDLTAEWRIFHQVSPEMTPPEDAVVFSVSRLGIPGADWWLPTSSDPPAADLAPADLDLLRLEHGVPDWPHELQVGVLPQEARLEDRAVSFRKGCYIGQEVVSRLKSVGQVNRLLFPLEVVEGSAAEGDRLFTVEGAEAGFLTSVRFHPHLQKSIALGYLKRTLARADAQYGAGPEASRLTAKVALREPPPVAPVDS